MSDEGRTAKVEPGALDRALSGMKADIFYLKGGYAAYEKQLQMQVAMLNRTTATISQSPSRKQTRGSVGGGRRVKKSCGCSG